MAANGRLPASSLGPIPGRNAGLTRPAALSYTAMHYRSLKLTGVSLHIVDGSVGRSYRSYARQVLAKRIYGSNAATPGYSNHGWALAVDLLTPAQRSAIDKVGAPFGWAKRWSDASWEWWHVKHRGGVWKPGPTLPRGVLTLVERQAADKLIYHRREYRREAASGKGPRYHRNYKWAKWWNKRIARLVAVIEKAVKKGGGKPHNRIRRRQVLLDVLRGKYD